MEVRLREILKLRNPLALIDLRSKFYHHPGQPWQGQIAWTHRSCSQLLVRNQSRPHLNRFSARPLQIAAVEVLPAALSGILRV